MRVTKGSGNVFLDLGFDVAEAENLRIRSRLMIALTRYVQDRKLTQLGAAKLMGVSQPRISDLVRGKIGLFTIDTLVNMATAAGLKVEFAVSGTRPMARRKRVA
jgi:predicted XRE-type DNA-binding protein